MIVRHGSLRKVFAAGLLALIALGPLGAGCQREVKTRRWQPVYGTAPGALPPAEPEPEEDVVDSVGSFLFGWLDDGDSEGEGRRRHPAVQRLPNQVNDPIPPRDPDWPPAPGGEGPSREPADHQTSKNR